MENNSVAYKDLPKVALLIITVALLVTFLFFISPFFGVLILAGIIAVDVMPMNKWLTSKLKYKTLASLITLVLVVIVILTPFTLFTIFITNEAVDAYQSVSQTSDLNTLSNDIRLLPAKFQDSAIGQWFTREVKISTEDIATFIQKAVTDSLQSFSTFLVTQTTNIFKQLSLFVLYVITFFLALFYFIFDGDKLVKQIRELLPLPVKYTGTLFNRLNALSKGIVYGVFGAAIVQGLLSGLGFFLAGIENAAFWGTIMALLSPVPYIGASIIWFPASLYLIISGHLLAGGFLMAWGLLVVSLADNLVRPYLIGKSTAINSLAVFLTLIGGVLTLGTKGLIFGPFLLTLLLSFLHIYKMEYATILKKSDKK